MIFMINHRGYKVRIFPPHNHVHAILTNNLGNSIPCGEIKSSPLIILFWIWKPMILMLIKSGVIYKEKRKEERWGYMAGRNSGVYDYDNKFDCWNDRGFNALSKTGIYVNVSGFNNALKGAFCSQLFIRDTALCISIFSDVRKIIFS